MLKRFIAFSMIGMFLLFTAGCNLIQLALSAAAAYGMSQIGKH
jgi:hypothetical protein